MENDKDIQKKTYIFRILDELKERGEKINADKLAKLAQMGKQTVLPYYNQWRFLDEAQQQGDNDLPQELVLNLQRLLIQWKSDISKELVEVRSQAANKQSILEKAVQDLTEEKADIEQKNQQLWHNNDALEASLREKNNLIQQLEQEITNLANEKSQQSHKVKDLQTAVKALKVEHTEAIAAQETKLDQQYSRQIDHWIKSLDDERTQKQALQKEHQSLHTQLLSVEKEKNLMANKVILKEQALEEANNATSTLQDEIDRVKPQLVIFSQVKELLHVDAKEVVSTLSICLEQIKELTVVKQQLQNNLQRMEKLELSLSEKDKKISESQGVALELEKSRGYALAMEKALAQAVKSEKE
ncbi:DNA-binding protein [Candidatus Sororendozoicomonas aggregata]|uniref:DNA-binding protein n=1 Tax=Candidatus Sororendozoicomonas aggregata TaxID=3073239 RepID=UPI002ED16668